MDYKQAGVDVQKSDEFTSFIGFKDFGATIDLGNQRVVLSTDGVGTKVLVADYFQKYDTIGIDLVAMCANDVICQGAYPHSFLDYYATAKLDLDKGKQLIQGIRYGCELAECSLVGGETAEMPGVYEGSKFDLAGFMMAICKGKTLPKKEDMVEGDYLIALPSSGPHSNGYSLLRNLYVDNGYKYDDWLLTPTRIYLPEFKIIHPYIKGIANITGGGIHGNLPRILPNHLTYSIKETVLSDEWKCIFDLAQIDMHSFESTFNCGYGMIAVIDASSLVDIAFQVLDLQIIGQLVKS